MTTWSFRSVQRPTVEPRWETGISRGGFRAVPRTASPLIRGNQVVPSGLEKAQSCLRVSTKYPMAIMNNCCFLTTKHYFLKYCTLGFLLWNHLPPTGRGPDGRVHPGTCPSTVQAKRDSGISFARASPSHPTAATGRHTVGSNDSSSWPSQDCQAVSSCY